MLKFWDQFESLVAAILAAVALIVFLYGMVARFAFPHLAPDWVLEVTIFLLIWAMLISGSGLAARSRHVRADLIVSRFPRPVQVTLEAFGMLVAVIFCVVLVVSGVEVVQFAIDFDERTLNSLRIPMSYYYACVPVAFTLMAIRFLQHFVSLVRTREPTFDLDHHLDPSATID